MIYDVQQAFLNNYNKDTLTIEFPKVVEHLQGTDSNFEMVVRTCKQCKEEANVQV